MTIHGGRRVSDCKFARRTIHMISFVILSWQLALLCGSHHTSLASLRRIRPLALRLLSACVHILAPGACPQLGRAAGAVQGEAARYRAPCSTISIKSLSARAPSTEQPACPHPNTKNAACEKLPCHRCFGVINAICC